MIVVQIASRSLGENITDWLSEGGHNMASFNRNKIINFNQSSIGSAVQCEGGDVVKT